MNTAQFSDLNIDKLQEIIRKFFKPRSIYSFIKEVRLYESFRPKQRFYNLVFIVDPVSKPEDYPDKGYSEGRLGGLENDVTKEIEYTQEQLEADLKAGYRLINDMPDGHKEYYRYTDLLGKINSSPSKYLEGLETVYLESKAARHKSASEWMAWVAHADELDKAIDSLGEFIETDGFVRVFGGDEQGKQEAPAEKESAPVDTVSLAPGNDHFRELGRTGGKKEKFNKGILQAVIEYIQEDPKRGQWPNTKIANGFCKKYHNNSPCCVEIAGNSYEVYCEGRIIYSSQGVSGKLKKSHEKTHNKEIKKGTLIKTYIPRAMKAIKEAAIKQEPIKE